jgi:23S rRNA (adenine-N6)-dimethyltransferase
VSAVKRTPRDERRRRLGQNFLQPDVAEGLVAAASFRPDDLVVEIGAGLGRCTFPLAERVQRVIGVEVDPALAARLRLALERRRIANVSVVCADARRYRFPNRPFRAFGSLPFGATTALMRHLFDDPDGGLVRADLVIQWEVARKRAAVPPTTLLSAAWTPWWTFELGQRVAAHSFRPVPAVDAAVLTVARRTSELLPVNMATLYAEFIREHWDTSRQRDGRAQGHSALPGNGVVET